MSINDWSPEKMLRIQFTKRLRKGYLNNARLDVSCREIDNFLMEDETCIVCIMADDETEYYFTDLRVISMSDVPLRDILACDLWFFDNPVKIYEWESAQEKKDYLRLLLLIQITIKFSSPA